MPPQLDKAQTQHKRWQSLGKTNPDKKRLEGDIEDECKSIAWQVGFLQARSLYQNKLNTLDTGGQSQALRPADAQAGMTATVEHARPCIAPRKRHNIRMC